MMASPLVVLQGLGGNGGALSLLQGFFTTPLGKCASSRCLLNTYKTHELCKSCPSSRL